MFASTSRWGNRLNNREDACGIDEESEPHVSRSQVRNSNFKRDVTVFIVMQEAEHKASGSLNHEQEKGLALELGKVCIIRFSPEGRDL